MLKIPVIKLEVKEKQSGFLRLKEKLLKKHCIYKIMTRIKRGVMAHKRRQNIIKQAKGFKWGRKSKYKLAKDALRHAWTYAYRDRKVRKRDFRRLWQIKINAAVRQQGITYSRFIDLLLLVVHPLDHRGLRGGGSRALPHRTHRHSCWHQKLLTLPSRPPPTL